MINSYVNPPTTPEQELHAELMTECIQFYGHEVTFIPREIIETNDILNEVVKSEFTKGIPIEMYLESVDGYEGDGEFVSRFGLELRDQVKLVVMKKRWEDEIEGVIERERPNEGDLVYFPLVKGLFEIKYVDGNSPFFQLNNAPVYKMTCELYEYSMDTIDTGIDEIDSFDDLLGSQIEITLDNTSGEFTDDDVISSTDSEVRGEIVTIESDGTLIVTGTTGNRNWIVGERINGVSSGAEGNITHIEAFANIDDYDNEADNVAFEDEMDEFIDFTENNPFGNPNFVD